VTREVQEVEARGLRFVDTPGFDAEHEAEAALGPWLDGWDGVVWVTDGLQPWTATERRVAAAVLPSDLPLWVVVSKADLLPPEEVAAVVDRVRVLTGGQRARAIVPADLRSARRGAGGPPPIEPPSPGPRRSARIRAGVARVRAALAAAPAAVDPEEVQDRWRSGVRAAVGQAESAVLGEPGLDATEAFALLEVGGRSLREELARLVAPFELPELPRAPTGFGDRPPSVRDRLAGTAGVLRRLRSEGADWLAAGEALLGAEWTAAPRMRAGRAAREHLLRSLDAVEASLYDGASLEVR
jgi:hypothetical protein